MPADRYGAHGWTAQLVDPANTARCATVLLPPDAGARRSRGRAARMARAVGWTVADFYATGSPVDRMRALAAQHVGQASA